MKRIMMITATVLLAGMVISGCGSKEEPDASAGEITRETSAELTTETKTDVVKNEATTGESMSTKNPETNTTMETTVPVEVKTTVPEVTTSNQLETTQAPEPQTEPPTPAPEPQTEAPTPAPEPQTELPTQAPEPQTEAPTPAPEPQTEPTTERQKTQAEYLAEFKENYRNLRKSLYGDTPAGDPQWNDTLYKIAKLRADEIVGYNFGHTSPNGYLNGYHVLECISQAPGYEASWNGWCQSSDHYDILCNQRMDMYAVAVGEGGCVFLIASSKDWNGEAYADSQTAINEEEAKQLAINDYGANNSNWKEVLENDVLWWICKDEDGNERFDITYDIYIKEYWQSCYDWYTQHYGEKVVK